MTTRPLLTECSTSAELDRWYWTRAELAGAARAWGVPATGAKTALTAALRDHLDGRPPRPTVRRPPAAPALPEPVGPTTPLPRGQRCSQQLRAACVAEAGPSFTFDGPVRAFVAATDGTATVGDLVEHWRRTRGRPPGDIEPQFELNRFLRRWHGDHPHEGRSAALAAWWAYRAQPREPAG